MVDCHAESDVAGHAALPGLEAAGAVGHLVAIGLHPGRGAQVEHDRVQPLEQRGPHVQEAGAAWAAQELAPRGGEDVTAELVDVE